MIKCLILAYLAISREIFRKIIKTVRNKAYPNETKSNACALITIERQMKKRTVAEETRNA